MLKDLVAYIHITFSLILTTYFLWRSEFLDLYALLYFILMNLSWVIFNNECLVSYLYKKLNDSNYFLGKTTTIDDYILVLGETNAHIFVEYLIPLIYIGNIGAVLYFGKIDKTLKYGMALGLLSYISYTISLRLDKTYERTKNTIKIVHGLLYSGLLYLALESLF